MSRSIPFEIQLEIMIETKLAMLAHYHWESVKFLVDRSAEWLLVANAEDAMMILCCEALQ